MPSPPNEDDGIVFVEGGEQDSFEGNDGGMQDPGMGADFGMPDMQDEVEIENSASKVASAPAKNILILGIMVIASAIFIYKMIFQKSKEEVVKETRQEQVASQPVEAAALPTRQEETPQVNIGVVDTPELPTIENVQQPPLPLPAPPPEPEPIKVEPKPVVVPPPVVVTPSPEPIGEEVLVEPGLDPTIGAEAPPAGPTFEQRVFARRGKNGVIKNSGGMPSQAGELDAGAVGNSSVSPIKATKVEDLGLMILQGKMLDAVLETTINTDLPGSLRAVISRDVYAEAGKTILIPRGSRLIGSYSSGIQPGQQRVVVTWGRVIRPDGVDIDIASPGTDQLGRSGMTGIVDNKYFEMFGNSLLISAVTIGGTIMLGKVQDAQTVSTTTSTAGAAEGGGSASTTTGAPADSAILQGVQSLGDTAKQIAKGSSTQPTIIVNQGARIKVFVNKDLIFPASVVKRVTSGN